MNKLFISGLLVFIILLTVLLSAPVEAVRMNLELQVGNQSGNPGYGLDLLLGIDNWSASFIYYQQEDNYSNINILGNFHLPDHYLLDYYTYLMFGLSQLEYENPPEKYNGFMLGANFERHVTENVLAHTDLRAGIYPGKLAFFYDVGASYMFTDYVGAKASFFGLNTDYGGSVALRIKF